MNRPPYRLRLRGGATERCRKRHAPIVAAALFVAVAAGSPAPAQLVNSGFEQVTPNGTLSGWRVLAGLDAGRYGAPDFALTFDEIIPVRAKGGHTGDYCAGFPAEGTWRAPVFGHGHGRNADQPDGKRRGKAALCQTVQLEPGTYRFQAYLRTADGALWAGAFSLGWSLSDPPRYAHDDSSRIHWKSGLAVKTALVGRLPERGEWWPYSTDPFTLDAAGAVTVWIRFDYVNENQMDTRWQVDDAAIVPMQPAPTGGALFGVVRDLRDRPVSGITVTLTPGGSTAVTDKYGRFAFRGLPEGSFTLTAEGDGYRFVMLEPDPIDVTTDRPAGVEVYLRGPSEGG
jgi:hypothetical protein